MTRFVLQGRRLPDHLVSITWEDGRLSGDPDAVAMVLYLAEAYEGRWLELPGCPGTQHRHLQSPYTSRELMEMVLVGRPRLVEGALPRLPDPPPGAIR